MASEIKAEDLAPGTGFEVEVKDGMFHVSIYYDWNYRHHGHDGEGVGATFTEAVGMAIQDAEGDLDD